MIYIIPYYRLTRISPVYYVIISKNCPGTAFVAKSSQSFIRLPCWDAGFPGKTAPGCSCLLSRVEILEQILHLMNSPLKAMHCLRHGESPDILWFCFQRSGIGQTAGVLCAVQNCTGKRMCWTGWTSNLFCRSR